MTYHYSDTSREHDPHALPDVEVFYVSKDSTDVEYYHAGPGWYWWSCFPGCLPDSEPVGPFATSDEALEDARGSNDGPDEG